MKVTGFICCVFGLMAMISMTDASDLQDKITRPFIDSLSTEDSPKDKRPFCNAFTGCGKKRSFNSDNLDNLDESSVRFRIPIPIYRAFLRALSQEPRESLARETDLDNAVPELTAIEYPSYVVQRMQNRQRYQS